MANVKKRHRNPRFIFIAAAAVILISVLAILSVVYLKERNVRQRYQDELTRLAQPDMLAKIIITGFGRTIAVEDEQSLSAFAEAFGEMRLSTVAVKGSGNALPEGSIMVTMRCELSDGTAKTMTSPYFSFEAGQEDAYYYNTITDDKLWYCIAQLFDIPVEE